MGVGDSSQNIEIVQNLELGFSVSLLLIYCLCVSCFMSSLNITMDSADKSSLHI